MVPQVPTFYNTSGTTMKKHVSPVQWFDLGLVKSDVSSKLAYCIISVLLYTYEMCDDVYMPM